jgi:hypothetical protein
MDPATVFLLPVALAVGLWLLARAIAKRAAKHGVTVRRKYPKRRSSPWIRRKSGKPAGEPPDATDEPTDVLEIEASGDFRVPKKPYYLRQSKD